MRNLIIMSLVGGVCGLVLLVVKPITKKLLGYTWQFYIWLVPLVAFVLPVSFKIPAEAGVERVVGRIPAEIIKNAESVSKVSAEVLPDIRVIWISGIFAVVVFRAVSYILFLKKAKLRSHRDFGIDAPFCVFRSRDVRSPVLAGIIRPVLFVPENLDGTALEYTLMHESVHFRRRDIWYKWGALFVQTVHWFNPVAFIILKQIDEDCEISCDYTVSGSMNHEEKKEYMKIILNMASEKQLLTTHMADTKRSIKKRFGAISGKRVKHNFFAGICITVMISLSVFVTSGFAMRERYIVNTSANKMSEKATVIKETEDKKIQNNPDDSNSWVNETPLKDEDNLIQSYAEMPVETDNGYDYIPGDLIISEISEPLSGREYSYNSNERAPAVITATPGADGRISVHFNCDYPTAVAELSISGLSEECDTVGYSIPTDPARRYDICGLEPGCEYEIGINTYCPGNYDINGNITIVEE